MSTCGIYCITINGGQYIGSSKNIEKRYTAHLRSLRNNKHHSIYLQRVFNKYGEKELSLKVVCIVKKEECLVEMEQFFLDVIKPKYNMSPTANSPKGVKHTEQAKRNMSNAKKGKKMSEHFIELQKERMKNYRASEETKQKQREACKHRKPITDETRRKMSESAKNRPPVSEETKTLRNSKLRGQTRSEETKAKMSKALKGKYIGGKHTEEHKQKISESLKRAYSEGRHSKVGFKKGNKYQKWLGKKHTVESIQKMRQVQKRKG
jgi:group I intron endonuclease